MGATVINLESHAERLSLALPAIEGQVTQVLGMLIEGNIKGAAVGDLYRVGARDQDILAEVVALKGDSAVLMPFGHLNGLSIGARLTPEGVASSCPVGEALKGRVIDALGRPLDNGPMPMIRERRPIYGDPLAPMDRRPVAEQMSLGVRSLDSFVPCGLGQRLGIFAGPGVGKSVLLGMIAKAASADVVVLALVGERGREVGHFVDKILGVAGLKNSVVVVATSDRPPPERVRAAFVATTIAEYFRDKGQNVLLFVDSLTRFSMAQREIGLAIGEPPSTKGYPPSAFALMPKLLERAAPARKGGSVTGLYTVLVEGDDMTDPVADAARGLLDGHIILSRSLAEQGHYPAVDVVKSLSRVESELLGKQHIQAARKVRRWLSILEESRDLISVGAYRPGADLDLDQAMRMQTLIQDFLQQDMDESTDLAETLNTIVELVERAE
jgi:flagellum-specific ATP synthase